MTCLEMMKSRNATMSHSFFETDNIIAGFDLQFKKKNDASLFITTQSILKKLQSSKIAKIN